MNRIEPFRTTMNSNFAIVQMLLLLFPATAINLSIFWLGKIQNLCLKSSCLWKCHVFSKKMILPNVFGYGVAIFGLLVGFAIDWILGNPITEQSFDWGIWSCLLANLIIILWICARRLWSTAGKLIRKLTRSLKPERFEFIVSICALFASAPAQPEHRPPIRV